MSLVHNRLPNYASGCQQASSQRKWMRYQTSTFNYYSFKCIKTLYDIQNLIKKTLNQTFLFSSKFKEKTSHEINFDGTEVFKRKLRLNISLLLISLSTIQISQQLPKRFY